MIKIITRIIPEQKEEILIRHCTQCTHFKESKQKNYYNFTYCDLNNKTIPYEYKYPIPDWCPLP